MEVRRGLVRCSTLWAAGLLPSCLPLGVSARPPACSFWAQVPPSTMLLTSTVGRCITGRRSRG